MAINMNVLLISVQADLDVLGLKYLHYTLLKHGVNSFLLCLPNIKQRDAASVGNLKQFIAKLSPQLIGISLMSIEFNDAAYLTQYLKKEFASITIVWGGIHPTIAPEMCLDYADYVCIGEGERTIVDMANAIKERGDLTSINNLCYIKDNEAKRNPLYPLIDNLDEVPAYDLIPVNGFLQDKAGAIVPIDQKVFKKYARYRGTTYSTISSRGCPFSCSYCCNNFLTHLYNSKKIRRRSIPSLISELERCLSNNPGIEYINFQDDCFMACSDEHLKNFCQEYKNKIRKPFIIRSIPIYINQDKIRSLKDAGLAWISIGIQSGSDRVCKEVYKRKTSKIDVLRAANIINKFDVGVYYDVILDNPFETTADRIETIKVLMEIPRPFHAQFFSLTFYFGTELYERAQKECPELIEDCRRKDYEVYNQDTLNAMIRLAAFIDKKQMQKLLELYQENPTGRKFKFWLALARIFSFLIKEPLTYFKVIKLSQNGSFLRTLKVLPNYFEHGVVRYLNQLRTRKPPTADFST
jgi:radical SAM superfamily enzyme YgiQ (UPF0313 family)